MKIFFFLSMRKMDIYHCYCEIITRFNDEGSRRIENLDISILFIHKTKCKHEQTDRITLFRLTKDIQ